MGKICENCQHFRINRDKQEYFAHCKHFDRLSDDLKVCGMFNLENQENER